MDRRQAIACTALCGTIALAGCTELVHRARGVNTPLSLVVESAPGELRSVNIRIERDGAQVFEGSASFDADGSYTGIDGDNYREAAFDEAGEYTVVAETTNSRDDSTSEISWRDLADCNDRGIHIRLEEASVRTAFWQTDADCGGLDRL